MINKRIVLGMLNVSFFLVAAYMLILVDHNSALGSVCLRVGIILLTINLAWPTLQGKSIKLPPFVIATLVGAALMIAIRPTLFRVIFVVVAAALIIHFGLTFVAEKTGSKRNSQK